MDLSMPPVPPRPPPPPHAVSPPLPAAPGTSPQQPGPPPSPATSPLPLVLGGAAGTAAAARSLAEELQAGLMPLLDPRGQAVAQGAPGLERPYARDECVHVFRVRSKRTGRTRSLVAWLRHTKHAQENLLMAIRCNDPTRVRLLVGMGADVNKADSLTRQTPLQLAEAIGSTGAAAVLTELGALRNPQPTPSFEVAPRSPRRDLLQMLLGGDTLERLRNCRRHLSEEGAPGGGAVGQGVLMAAGGELRPEQRDALRMSRRLIQARELLRNVRRRRVASEMGRVMDQMENLNLQSAGSSARAPAPPRLDVNGEFSRLSLTSGAGESDSNSAPQPQGGASGQ